MRSNKEYDEMSTKGYWDRREAFILEEEKFEAEQAASPEAQHRERMAECAYLNSEAKERFLPPEMEARRILLNAERAAYIAKQNQQ